MIDQSQAVSSRRCIRFVAAWATTAALALSSAVVLGEAQAGDAHPSATRPADPAKVLQPADQPLDARIKSEKITSYDPPPLPELVTIPLGPQHRIAASSDQVPIGLDHWNKAQAALEKGMAYLRANQSPRGGWSIDAQAAPTDQPDKPSPVSVAVSALALKALAQAEGQKLDDAAFNKAVRYVLDGREDEGMFGAAGNANTVANYVTATVVSALSAIDRNRFAPEINPAVAWIDSTQWDQSEGVNPSQDWFGGFGYGKHGRPDLSNSQMTLEALYDSGMSPEEPAFQRAIAFVSRTQNLQATNHAPWAGNDGGFIYTPANGGESMASEAAGEGRHGEKSPEALKYAASKDSGEIPAGGPIKSLRSYGSMTYAGFKSLLYAGLSPDDLRVRAAFDWIRQHYTFDENPGLKQQGLYYYYHAMARALRIAQQKEIADARGVQHNWREDLIDALVKRQREDGSWINPADRWMEADPNLVTAYALLALEETLKPVMVAE